VVGWNGRIDESSFFVVWLSRLMQSYLAIPPLLIAYIHEPMATNRIMVAFLYAGLRTLLVLVGRMLAIAAFEGLRFTASCTSPVKQFTESVRREIRGKSANAGYVTEVDL
jgi:hypothetical protein